MATITGAHPPSDQISGFILEEKYTSLLLTKTMSPQGPFSGSPGAFDHPLQM